MNTKTQPDDFAAKNEIAQNPTGIRPESIVPASDLASIPDDVKKNILGMDTIEFDQTLLKILAVQGQLYSVDHIVLTLWLKYQKKHDRMHVIRRLRALVNQGLVKKLAKARGIYSITDAGRTLVTPAAPAAE